MPKWFMIENIDHPQNPWAVWQLTDQWKVPQGTAASINEGLQRLDIKQGDYILLKCGGERFTLIVAAHIKPEDIKP